MKKVLYGSSALVAAGAMAAAPAAAEEGVKLGLGGYYNTFFWIGDYDENSSDPRDLGTTGLYNEGEVHFKGSTTLDNGITFGVQIELEVNGSGDRIDEHYAFISGSFGRLVIGDENSVAYMMQYGAPNAGVLVNSGWITVFVPPPQATGGTTTMGSVTTSSGGVITGTLTTTVTLVSSPSTATFRAPSLSTYVDLGNDDSGLMYYSPRFSGFQVGVSYAPVAQIDGEGKNFPVQADKNTENHDLMAVGANFVESFGGFDVAVAGGYRRAEASSGTDPEQWSAGLNLGFAGFTVGGSFAIEDSARSNDGWSADVGATYGTGPWTVGVTAFHSEVEGTAGGGEDELDAITGGVQYAVGPGITATAALLYAEWDEEAGNDADGFGGMFGMKIGF